MTLTVNTGTPASLAARTIAAAGSDFTALRASAQGFFCSIACTCASWAASSSLAICTSTSKPDSAPASWKPRCIAT
jgi:hypothetical protein